MEIILKREPKIRISYDEMEAYLLLPVRRKDEEAYTEEEVFDAIAKRGVRFGVDEGIAKITQKLDIGLNNISAQYVGVGFADSSQSLTVNIPNLKVKLDWNISTNLDAADIRVNLTRPINETVIITFDGNPKTFISENGIVNYKIENLTLGNHSVKISLESDCFEASDVIANFMIAP